MIHPRVPFAPFATRDTRGTVILILMRVLTVDGHGEESVGVRVPAAVPGCDGVFSSLVRTRLTLTFTFNMAERVPDTFPNKGKLEEQRDGICQADLGAVSGLVDLNLLMKTSTSKSSLIPAITYLHGSVCVKRSFIPTSHYYQVGTHTTVRTRFPHRRSTPTSMARNPIGSIPTP